MSRRALTVWSVLVVGIGVGVGPALAAHKSLSALLPGNPLEGSRLFAGKECLRCHAVHGVGGTAGPDLGRGILNRPLLEIAGDMWNHSPGMEHVFREQRVTRPQFEPKEMASLLAFLYYLGSLERPGDAVVGAQLFDDKDCRRCHSLEGQGGHLGPALDTYSRYASPLFLTTALWNRGKAMAEAMESMGISRPTLQGNDVPDILAYIRSAEGGTERVYARVGRPKRGEELFVTKRCVACHAVHGDGGTVGPDLGVTLRGNLTQITGTMWNHGPNMWGKMEEEGIEFPTFDTAEMGDLISYLYFFQFIDPPGDPVKGRAVYAEKQCDICHAAADRGLAAAPPLAGQVESLRTPLDIITQMWNHAGQMEERMAEVNVEWPLLKGREMADLIAYLLRGQPAAGEPTGSTGPAPRPGGG